MRMEQSPESGKGLLIFISLIVVSGLSYLLGYSIAKRGERDKKAEEAQTIRKKRKGSPAGR